MARARTGEVRERQRHDGTVLFSLRFRALGGRHTIPLGTDAEGWNRKRAEGELRRQLARVEAGIWRPPEEEQFEAPPAATFHEEASRWLKRRRHELRESTYRDYRWRLVNHLLPFFARLNPEQITFDLVDRYREQKLAERHELEELRARGVVLRDEKGRPETALSNESINKTLSLLAHVLDDVIERRQLLMPNPARGRRRRLRADKPKRTFLEADELVSLIDAATLIDERRSGATSDGRALEARRMRDEQGLPWKEVATRLDAAVSTAIYWYQRGDTGGRRRPRVRRAIIATLGCSGLRASELCRLRQRDVDLAHGRLLVRDAKTPAGVREVDMTPWLREELSDYMAAIGERKPGAPAFPTERGNARDRHNLLNRVIRPATKEANAPREERDLPPVRVGVTTHSLRRTYISLMLAAGADLKYVMQQVGHEDSKTVLEIYAQVLRRDRRAVGAAFDALMRDAVPLGAGADLAGLDDLESAARY